MKLRLLFLPFILLVAALAIAGCGDDDDGGNGGDDGGDGGEPTASAPADDGDGGGDDGDEPTEAPDDSGDDDGDGNGGGGGGSGSATLTIGDVTYEFDNVGCVFSAEAAGNEDFPFNLAAFGELDGHRTQLSADIYDPSGEQRHEGEGVSHHIDYDDVDDFENPVVSWSTVGESLGEGIETVLTIDGKHVSGVGSFDDNTTEEFERIDGTLEVDCP